MVSAPVETWGKVSYVSRAFRADAGIDVDAFLIGNTKVSLPDDYVMVEGSGSVDWLDPETDTHKALRYDADFVEWLNANDLLVARITVLCFKNPLRRLDAQGDGG